jgi:transposase-like protein
MKVKESAEAPDQSGNLSTEESKTITEQPSDPEVKAQARCRQHSAAYKLRILEELDRCTEPGGQGAILRREGLYTSHLVKWRKERRAGQLKALAPKKRGRREADPATIELARLQRENEKLKAKLERAEIIIRYQKKVADLLGFNPATEKGEDD